MKILVIQLARLGDIYMTWPALRGLRRKYPDAEIHLLTRPRFEGAVEGLDAINHHWSLETGKILKPLVVDDADIAVSLEQLSEVVDELKNQNFDWVINFTFSPASSFLTHSVSSLHSRVSGYSRFNDGTLCLSEDTSSYFYSQVGIDKPNRVHLTDIFAAMIDLSYEEADWYGPALQEMNFELPERFLTLHVGASEAHKSLSAAAWIIVLNNYGKKHGPLPVVLVGAAGESAVAEAIQAGTKNIQITNLVGKTKISDLFAILNETELLIGCDSAPIHMASLVNAPTLNVSVGDVNYWETGPKSALGFIYRITRSMNESATKLGNALHFLLNGEVAPEMITRSGGLVSYQQTDQGSVEHFSWGLVQALYLGGPYPMADRMEIIEGSMKLKEINDFAISQLKLIPTKGLEFIGPLLDQAEEVIQSISRLVPELSPLIKWYQAEKIGIGPGPMENMLAATLQVHEKLARHVEVYIPGDLMDDVIDQESRDGTL